MSGGRMVAGRMVAGRMACARMASARAAAARLALAVLAAGCDVPRGEGDAGHVPAAPNVVDPERVAVGDTVLGLAVVALEGGPSVVDSAWTGRARFAGEVTLTGRTVRHPDAPDVDAVCFEPDSVSALRLPRFPDDPRRVWFCFDDPAEALGALGDEPGRRATIIVDDYRTVLERSDAVDQARLVRVEPPRD